MIADDADALAVTFHRMMRAVLAAERPGADTLGRTIELARDWGTGPAADARLADALRRLHGEPDEAPATPESARGAAIGTFAANARRSREGEITPAEFHEIMDDDGGPTRG
ncbi:hypothetical protein GA0074696_3521 [Micromonospora purpureochromogenes]|uniref:Uncharacterized protein n=1 Tax=Micromonospora purpureochromogenes TaxID=47872 RepID=A0A1C4YMG7_9ACTN|nr:hypothetical protein [Micromonospora purpureochromogenes]SCF21952.1 hypothetical protein GA0074696_3521 [Micromonospora purpureochromogenes]